MGIMTEYESSYTQTLVPIGSSDEVALVIEPVDHVEIKTIPTEENKLYSSQ